MAWTPQDLRANATAPHVCLQASCQQETQYNSIKEMLENANCTTASNSRTAVAQGPGSRRPRPTAAAATGRLPQARVPAWIGSAPASYEVNRVKGELLSMKEEAVMVSCEAEMNRVRGAME